VTRASSAGTSGGSTNIVSFLASSTSGGISACEAMGIASSACGTSRGEEVAWHACSACASSRSACSTVGNSTLGADTGNRTVASLASDTTSTGIVTDSAVFKGIGIAVSASFFSNCRCKEDSADEGNEKFVHF